MRDSWRIGTWLDIHMMGSQARRPPDSQELPGFQATRWVRWVLDEGPRGRAMLFEIAEALAGGECSHRSSADEAVALVKRGLVEGRLKAYAQSHTGGGKGPTPAPPPKPKPPDKKDEKTFVAIELVTDEPEPKPVAFKKYRITLPDESVREGMLDANGKAMIPDIDPGTCKVSFPDFDAADWKPA